MKNKLNIKIVNNTSKNDHGDRLSDASSEMASHTLKREKNNADKTKEK
jgi:hypothetical protein